MYTRRFLDASTAGTSGAGLNVLQIEELAAEILRVVRKDLPAEIVSPNEMTLWIDSLDYAEQASQRFDRDASREILVEWARNEMLRKWIRSASYAPLAPRRKVFAPRETSYTRPIKDTFPIIPPPNF